MISHGQRWKFAFRAFFSLIFHGRIADDILAAFVKAPPAPPPVVPPVQPVAAPVDAADETDRALQILALFQRDGRLVDFLMEDLTGYVDAQIGAAVRDVHTACRHVLDRYVTLKPVLTEAEGARVSFDRGTDPARIRFVGNLGSTARFDGVVRHRGWEVERVGLPPLPSAGRSVIAPAEVEIG